MTTPTDWGHACSPTEKCTAHNLHCGYPNCAKGRGEGIHAKPVTTPTPKLQWGDVTSIPRMMKAVVEGRGIEEGCQLERDLAAAQSELASVKAENSKLRSALEIVHFKREPWQ